MSKEETGRRLREYRELKKISATDFAKMLGVRKSTVSMWEKGTNSFGVEKIKPICEILDITPTELLNYQGGNSETLEANEKKLVDIYQSVSQAGKDLIMSNAESVKTYEDNKIITFIPMFREGQIPMVEIPYYDQAAGMGTGQFVEDAIPKKLNVAQMNVPDHTDYIIDVTGDSMEPDFQSGDRLFIQVTKTLEIGDIGVFSFEGEQLVKEFGGGVLISRNKKYEPIKVNKDLHIQGKVLGKV